MLAIIVAISPASALAQQQFSPVQEAAMNLGRQIGLLTQMNADLQTQIIGLQAQIKALQDKYEPKKEPPKQ
jgi:hypothetical protein